MVRNRGRSERQSCATTLTSIIELESVNSHHHSGLHLTDCVIVFEMLLLPRIHLLIGAFQHVCFQALCRWGEHLLEGLQIVLWLEITIQNGSRRNVGSGDIVIDAMGDYVSAVSSVKEELVTNANLAE